MPVAAAMIPTYVGYVGSTRDALIIIQAVLTDRLQAVPRRPHDRERGDLIRSGNVFVFIEERSGIRRWTDGVAWSPSRILGRFLVYRELDRNALSAKDARGRHCSTEKPKKKRRSVGDGDSRPGAPQTISGSSFSSSSSSAGSVVGAALTSATSFGVPSTADVSATALDQDTSSVSGSNSSMNRSLVGSLIASYAFKDYGLIKKTLSLTVNRMDPRTRQPTVETIHLVSYYAAEDVLAGRFIRPINSPVLKDVQLSNELWAAVKESSLGGKVPIEDEAFYFMDQQVPNPNALALGLTASAIQYSQQQMGLLPQPIHQSQESQQSQHHHHVAPQKQQFSLQQQQPSQQQQIQQQFQIQQQQQELQQQFQIHQQQHQQELQQQQQHLFQTYPQGPMSFGSYNGYPLPSGSTPSLNTQQYNTHPAQGPSASFALPPPVPHLQHSNNSIGGSGTVGSNGSSDAPQSQQQVQPATTTTSSSSSSATHNFMNDLNLATSMYPPRLSQGYAAPGGNPSPQGAFIAPNYTMGQQQHNPHIPMTHTTPDSPTREKVEFPNSASIPPHSASSGSASHSSVPNFNVNQGSNMGPQFSRVGVEASSNPAHMVVPPGMQLNVAPPLSSSNGKWIGFDDQGSTYAANGGGYQVGASTGIQYGQPH